MAEVKASAIKAAAVEPAIATSSADNKEWVEIPAETLLGDVFPTVCLNWDRYEPGKRYFVSSEVANEIKRIIKTRNAYDRRLLNPRADAKTMRELHAQGRIPMARTATDDELEACLQ